MEESYKKICIELGSEPEKVVFLTDNVKGNVGIFSIFSGLVVLDSWLALHPHISCNGEVVQRSIPLLNSPDETSLLPEFDHWNYH